MFSFPPPVRTPTFSLISAQHFFFVKIKIKKILLKQSLCFEGFCRFYLNGFFILKIKKKLLKKSLCFEGFYRFSLNGFLFQNKKRNYLSNLSVLRGFTGFLLIVFYFKTKKKLLKKSLCSEGFSDFL